jgi:hypothetical protein
MTSRRSPDPCVACAVVFIGLVWLVILAAALGRAAVS